MGSDWRLIPMRLILVRHGWASYAERRIFGGEKGCSGLTAQGRIQAQRLCDRLRNWEELPETALLFSSPLPRAMETAQLLAPAFAGHTIHREPALEEMGVGIADGMTWDEFESRFGYFDERAEPDRLWAPEGESWNMFRRRVCAFLDRVRSDHPDETVVAITHGGVIDVTMRELLGIPINHARMPLNSNTSGLTEWSWSGDASWNLVRYNDTAHLEAMG
ncbi:MAG: histidine phosphatase family protein [Thermomicrobiales bacterium]